MPHEINAYQCDYCNRTFYRKVDAVNHECACKYNIKSQKAEIDGLKRENEIFNEANQRNQRDKEIEELQSQIDGLHVYANKIKSEVYKEFAEKVKDIAFALLPNDTARDGFVLHLVNLLKENDCEDIFSPPSYVPLKKR